MVSSGFVGSTRPGASAPSTAAVAGEGGGKSRPSASQKSSAMALNTPESEMMAAPPRGSDGQRIMSSLRSSSSSRVSTMAMPAWVTSARIIA